MTTPKPRETSEDARAIIIAAAIHDATAALEDIAGSLDDIRRSAKGGKE